MDPAITELERWLAPLAFVALSLAFAVSEARWPQRPVRQFRDGLALDLAGVVIAALVSGAAAAGTLAVLASFAPPKLPGPLAHPVARGALFLVLTDLSRFLAHFWMHRPWPWRFHHFHHSPRTIYWLSGNRATPVHVVLFAAPTAAWMWTLQPSLGVVAVNIVAMVFWNHFMHTNVRLPARWQALLEWIVTTPRYHHVHHAKDPALYKKNLASIFTLWDRLAGTYVDPDRVAAESLTFGVGEEGTSGASTVRMVVGL
ncbi:MAG TPA: sterol desaturase family protein [Kofleriaceae bacterium]|nr:sterol desaturase family protein [Kofleriaceae bacterium]